MTSGGALNYPLNKSGNAYLETNIDSLVATSTIIGRKTFTNLPAFNGGTLNLGNLTVERYCPGTPVVTYEGKTYNTVQIGSQCWLKENLDVGTMIQGSADATYNGVIEKYCFGNDPNNCATYGGLYQWNEAMQYSTFEGSKGICPTGWHIPKYTEFQTLMDAVGSDGNALKAIGQGLGKGAGTNISGFSALLGGVRFIDGYFEESGVTANFWSSTESGPAAPAAYFQFLVDYVSILNLGNYYKVMGYSVRCLKD